MMRFRIVGLLVLVGLKTTLSAQEAQFNQFFATETLFNPASVGNGAFANGDMRRQVNRFGLSYRNQWPSLPIGLNSAAISFDRSISNSFGGFGAYVIHDAFLYNSFNSTQATIQYSYYIPLGQDNWRIRMGMEASGVNKNININNLRFPDQIDDNTGEISATSEILNARNINFFDMGVGALLQGKNCELGYSVKNIVSPFYTFIGTETEEIRMSHNASVRYNFRVGNNDNLPTYLSVKALMNQQGAFSRWLFGGTYQTPQFSIGVFGQRLMKNELKMSGVSFFAGFKVNDLVVGLSQDVSLGQSRFVSSQSSEISLRLFINNPKSVDNQFQPLNKLVF